jgi:hypothetical protein
MTKKDYELIATSIREAREVVARESGNNAEVLGGANAGFYELAKILSARFFEQNPRFDDNRWMTATEVLHN